MIVDLILTILFAFVSFIFGLFPDFTPPDTTGWAGWLGSFGDYLGHATRWVNVPLLITLLQLTVTILVGYGVVKLVTWTLAHIPFVGSGAD